MQDLLAQLNEEQRQAARTVDGPLLIVAGAGTGKTRTLVSRLAYMAAGCGIDPARLLAITFTARAAEEMRQRLASLHFPGIDLSRIWVGTIHALCYEILKEHGSRIGIPADAGLILPADRMALIREAAAAVFPEDSARSVKKYELHITREKNTACGYDGLSPLTSAYQGLLQARGLLDFDDLILRVLELFATGPEALEAVRSRFSHVSVDEYQDVNAAQHGFIKALCPARPNLCAVGDADQAIYGFRGAQVEIFMRFQADFPDAAVVRLEQNYRSSATILEAAQAVIEKNSRRIKKHLMALRPAGDPVELWSLPTDQDEASSIAREVEGLMGGMRFESLTGEAVECVKGFGDIAVLYRLHQQGQSIKAALHSRGIPVEIAATSSGLEEPLIKTIILLLELIADPGNDVALAELLTDSPLAAGTQALEAVRSCAGEGKLFPALSRAHAGLPSRARQRLQALDGLVQKFTAQAEQLPIDGLINAIWQEVFGAEADKSDDHLAFITASMAFSGMPAAQAVPQFLRKLALLKEGEICAPRREAVTLMTVHGAKGLEFPVVFMAGLEHGLFPYQPDGAAAGAYDEEEERRLFYVGMTRARDRLYLLHARERFLFGQRRQMAPSCCLADLPPACCHRQERQRPQKPKQKQLKLFA